MRTVSEYLAKAAEFDLLARNAAVPQLKKRYTDVAESYRILASERKHLIAQGVLTPDPERNGAR